MPCLIGSTASGKSEVGLACARATGGEVIACDAFSVYRGLARLSAAPVAPPDVPHHLVGVLAPHERFSAARFLEEADRLVAEVRARGRRPWIVGGTALYLRTWLKGLGPTVPRDEALRARLSGLAREQGPAALHAELVRRDPERAAQVHPHDERRLVRALEIVAATGRPASAARTQWSGPDRVRARVVGLARRADDLDRRIRERTRRLFDEGVLEEVRAFRAASPSPEAVQALGFAEVEAVLDGRLSVGEAVEAVARATRRFARRQATFFRSFRDVLWLEVPPDEPPEATAARVLHGVGLGPPAPGGAPPAPPTRAGDQEPAGPTSA